jgi:hypothetical protein
MAMTAKNAIKEATVSAIVFRADGTVDTLGIISDTTKTKKKKKGKGK